MSDFISRPTAPCKNCPKKGCGPFHSSCEKYQTFQIELTNYNNHINKAKSKHVQEQAYIHEAVERCRRR